MTPAARGTSLTWFKSTYSSDQGGDCLEVAYRPTSGRAEGSARPDAVHIRDSKAGDGGPVLTVLPAAWTAFVASAVAV
ncbi:DUF397 domain-containing protein [Streptomyces sp. NPDC059166]|uniref:DUF397 domain-containing protein n=1 Tax=Streptomyces sp. NPDC059166 TaxID=3346752 RepID=UPI0036BBD4EE